ncbi:C40 family peptidase [Lacticaseibacillus jixiensis]|uniref:C40 family peptidase n=1 Tax=Lacticaseibacillus jixiensis TaxID=3231926 RepID=UPI0036F215F2
MKLMKTVTVLAAATVLAVVGVSTQSVSADSISDAKSALTTKQTESSALQQQLQQAQDAVTKINGQAEAKAVAIQKAQAQIKSATAKVASYNKQIDQAQQEVKARTTTMKKQLRSLQKEIGDSATGNIYIDFILNAHDLSDAVDRSFTVHKLNNANQEALAEVQAATSKLSDLKQAAADNKADLVQAEAKLETERDQIKSLAADASAKQAALQKQIDANKDAVAALQGNIAKANATAKAAATKAAQQAAASTKKAATATPIKQATATAAAVAPKPAATPSYTGSGSLGGIVGVAEQFIGVPYVYGGMSPSGFDCSGLVAYAAAKVGISLPHNAAAQSSMGHSVSMSALQPGDLLFWGGVGSAGHVAIYIGGGSYVHAPQPGESVTIQKMAYYAPNFARRL